jgi:hypothetical protein
MSAARGTAGYSAKGPSTSEVTGPVTYNLTESYADYHLLTVESKIVPASSPGSDSSPAAPTPLKP